MNRPKVFLDLDRTIFDTDRAIEFWQVWAEYYDIVPEICVAERDQFYIWKDETYMHDMSNQLRSYGIDSNQAYRQVIESEMSDGRLEMPYASELVTWLKGVADVAVLTYGPDDYQRCKAALCPSLVGIPVVTTLQPKLEILCESGDCWLIDDKDLGVKPPDNIHFVQVISPDDIVVQDKPWPIYSSLKAVKEYLYENLH